jgi:Ca2+-binding EF-hand superfamily protein
MPFFRFYDSDANGTIDYVEFRLLFKDLNECGTTKDEQRLIFDTADKDSDGEEDIMLLIT